MRENLPRLRGSLQGNGRLTEKIMQYWIGYAIPTIVVIAILAYAVARAGRLNPREKQRLEHKTDSLHRAEDPQR